MTAAQARRRPAWGRLGDELRRLRKQAGLSQATIGHQLGVSQTQVNRWETGGVNGGAPPSVAVVVNWARACEIAHPDLPALEELAVRALDEHRPYPQWGSLATIQEGVRADEATTMRLRNWNPWGIPGLLQTAAYAQAILELADLRRLGQVPQAVAIRLQRQAILHEPGRRFTFLLAEEGLCRRPATVEVQRAQLAHLVNVAGLPSVEFGVIPLGGQVLASHSAGFVLYEDRVDGGAPFVAIELPHERVEAAGPGDFALYQEMYGLLWQEAVTGAAAVAFVHDAAARL